ncbi:hypothetical protein PVAP13_8KG153904 [Panicum virgatum]|uniref:Ubiquitin-like protease family profile domain-containing protein n=1 Tax=Panicum virgatum TaxID=38727 RepID=A0A8T0PL49_PANVG|nr:hypothetical protein PVAP13_8KG153904 [Panicum virgatum]
MPSPCDLHVRARNISIHVAYGRPIPPGYTSVTVKQIIGNNEDLELDFVGGDGEKTLGDALHGVILWRKADIKLIASTTAPVQTDRPSPSLPSPEPAPSPPSPPAQRATKLGKKLLASLNNPPPPKNLPSDYERTLTKAHKVRNVKKKCGKTIPQLGTQQKELEPLWVTGFPLLHPTDVQLQADLQVAIFLSETGLTLEEAAGQVEAEIPVAPVLTPFQHGKPFVTEEEEKSLGTQMFNLHRWYLRMSNDEGKMFGIKYRDHDFFRGEDEFWVYFENLYHIYHRQALYASIITIWVLQEIQRSRKHGWHHQIGFMSPSLVNQKVLNENYKETCQNMYDSLTRHNYKSYIFIPYNFGFHWILLILSVETSNLIVFDSMRNPKSTIQHIIDPLNRVWKKFVKNNKGRGQWRPELNVNMYYSMSQMGDECYSTDRINAVCEELAGFILNEILDPRGEFYHDGHIHRGLPSSS